MRRFKPGDTIETREVWRGKKWEQRPAIVAEDNDELIALYTPPGSESLIAVDATGTKLRMPITDWKLEPTTRFTIELIALHVPGTDHSVLAIFDPPAGYGPWYINLESDLQRTEHGFDYEEHVLDILIDADMSTWRWKDEDELEEAVELGLFTGEQAVEFRAEGERALEWLLSRRRPYDRDWLSWRPPPEWGLALGKRRS
jgi:hypothetical protein